MQLDRSDALYETKLWLLERLGLAVKPIKWEKLDMVAAAVAARVLCLRQVELQQLRCIEEVQQPLNPRNEAASLAILVANQSVVCGSSSQRRQELQQLTAAYPVSLQQQQQHGQASAERPLSESATEKLCDSNNNISQQQQQQQQQQQHSQVSTQGPASTGASVKVCESTSDTSQQQSQQQQPQHGQASAEGLLSERATEKLPDSDNSIPQQQQQQQALAAAGTDTGASCTTVAGEQSHSSSSSSSYLLPLQQQQHKPVVCVPYEAGSLEQQLLSWALSQGASSQVIPARFLIGGGSSSSSSAGKDKSATADLADLLQQQQQPMAQDNASTIRGCAATSDLPAGSNIISLPVSLLVTYKTAAESDFGRVLNKIGLDSETLAVVWTMVERWDEESVARPFWQALPEQFSTGLGVPEPLIELLKGTPLHLEIISARQHIRQQYQDLQQTFKVLLAAYPSYLPESWFSLANYLWAVELWYAYAIQVKFPDGAIQSALAPFVSLLNHSPWPQIVHFSTVDLKTQQLSLTNFRPLQQHDQVLLSYGPLPNAQLLLFYGFTVQGNPFEELQLTLDLPQDQQQQNRSSSPAAKGDLADVGERRMLLRDLGLGLQYRLTVQQPAPPGLLAALRVLHCNREELQAVQAAVRLAIQQQVITGSTAVAVAAAGSSGESSSVKSASNKGKGSNSKASKNSKKANDGKLGTHQKMNNGSGVGNELERKWAAAALCYQVLGLPLSETTEAAVKQRLSCILTRLRAPYEACVGKIARRRQLQAMLVQQQKEKVQQGGLEGNGSQGAVSSSGSKTSPSEEGFLACVEVYARDLIALCSACGGGGC